MTTSYRSTGGMATTPAYAIAHLRTAHRDSVAALLTGVPTGYRAVDEPATFLP